MGKKEFKVDEQVKVTGPEKVENWTGVVVAVHSNYVDVKCTDRDDIRYSQVYSRIFKYVKHV